jgi:hypothetical protein
VLFCVTVRVCLCVCAWWEGEGHGSTSLYVTMEPPPTGRSSRCTRTNRERERERETYWRHLAARTVGLSSGADSCTAVTGAGVGAGGGGGGGGGAATRGGPQYAARTYRVPYCPSPSMTPCTNGSSAYRSTPSHTPAHHAAHGEPRGGVSAGDGDDGVARAAPHRVLAAMVVLSAYMSTCWGHAFRP